MNVYFSCSTKGISQYKSSFREIRDTIKKLGHKLTRDWIDYSINKAEAKTEDLPGAKVYPAVVSAILAADVLVIEASVPSLSLGHQLSLALDKRKKVLVLSQLPQRELEKTFIGGITSPLLTLRSYQRNEDLKNILENYFRDVEEGPKFRFNLVIGSDLQSYIEWASFYYKRSKTEIIKQAVLEKKGKDRNYKGKASFFA